MSKLVVANKDVILKERQDAIKDWENDGKCVSDSCRNFFLDDLRKKFFHFRISLTDVWAEDEHGDAEDEVLNSEESDQKLFLETNFWKVLQDFRVVEIVPIFVVCRKHELRHDVENLFGQIVSAFESDCREVLDESQGEVMQENEEQENDVIHFKIESCQFGVVVELKRVPGFVEFDRKVVHEDCAGGGQVPHDEVTQQVHQPECRSKVQDDRRQPGDEGKDRERGEGCPTDEGQKVSLVEGRVLEEANDEGRERPDGRQDDQVDAASGEEFLKNGFRWSLRVLQ